jgi:hypothetical protein
MGKWDEYTKTLPKADPLEDKGQDYVGRVLAERRRQVAEELKGDVELGGVARLYRRLRAELKEAEETVSGINLQLRAVEGLLEQAFEQADVSSLKQDGDSVRVELEPVPKVENKEALGVWLRSDPDLERLLTLNHQTLASLVKERLQAGEDTPGVLVKSRTKFVFTPGKA